MNKEELLHIFIVVFCCILIVAILAVPLELIFAVFEWQPLAGRVLIYGIMAVLCFYKGYDKVEIEKIEKEDNRWDK